MYVIRTMTSFLPATSVPFESPSQHLFKLSTDIINKTFVFIVAVLEMHWKHKHESAKELLIPDLVPVSGDLFGLGISHYEQQGKWGK